MSFCMTDMRAIREGLKLTQVELAERLGIHQTTVSRFETGDLALDRRTELALLALKDGSEPASKAA
jgi:transcriptional regulator with XRE-family HTH domain